MGQALSGWRGAATKLGRGAKAAEEQFPSTSSSALEEDTPIFMVGSRYTKPKTAEQIATEARWAEKAKLLYGQTRKATPDLKTRLRERVTDYRPEPPYDKPREANYDPASSREWNKSDPNYQFMVQKVASNVATKTEILNAEGPEKPAEPAAYRPPHLSRSRVDQAAIDRRVVPGKLNIVQLKQAFLLYHGKGEGDVKQMDVEGIAQKFEVNPEQLKTLFQYTSLAEGRPSDFTEFNKKYAKYAKKRY